MQGLLLCCEVHRSRNHRRVGTEMRRGHSICRCKKDKQQLLPPPSPNQASPASSSACVLSETFESKLYMRHWLLAQLCNEPVMQETPIWFLLKITSEEGLGTHSSILGLPQAQTGKDPLHCRRPGSSPWDGGSLRTPILCPGESSWTEALGGLQAWGGKELDMTE